MRLGTNCTGTTILARTGARTTWSDSASLISFSESGITSQKVRVKSNGVCAMEQKFEYVRGAPSAGSSAGTIVKLICLVGSAMRKSLILPHHPHDDALNLHLVGIREDRLHRGVGRLEPDLAARVAIELLQGDV